MSEEKSNTYDPEMRGSLFPEENRKDNGPDMTGTVQISGVTMRIAVWPSRKSKTSGKAYRPIKVEYKQGAKFFLAKVRPENVVVTGSTATAGDGEVTDEASTQAAEDMPF